MYVCIELKRKIIQDILQNNGYSTSVLKSISSSKKHKSETEKTQWSKFTYFGKETRPVAKVFKSTRLKVSYSTKSTLEKLLTKKHYPLKDKYENSGIYQLTCPTCNMKYTGQTGNPSGPAFKSTYGTLNMEMGNLVSPKTYWKMDTPSDPQKTS